MSGHPGESFASEASSTGGDASIPGTPPRSDRAKVRFAYGVPVALWVLVCALAGAAVAWIGHGGNDAPGVVGYALGSFLGVWLVTYVIGWVVFRITGRRLLPARVVICVIALITVVNTVNRTAEQSRELANQAAVARDLRGEVAKIADGVKANGRVAPLDATATVGGEAGEIQHFVKSYLNETIAEHNAYMAELEATGWPTLLDADRLGKDVGLVDSKAKVAAAKAIVAKYRRQSVASFERTMSAVRAMDASSDTKRGFVAGFLESSAKANAQRLHIWDLDEELVATTGQMVAFLAANRSRWSVEASQFAFDDARTLATFRGYSERIDGLLRSEDAIRKASMDKVDAQLKAVGQP
jgi:hypothetical protein